MIMFISEILMTVILIMGIIGGYFISIDSPQQYFSLRGGITGTGMYIICFALMLAPCLIELKEKLEWLVLVQGGVLNKTVKEVVNAEKTN